MCLLSLLRTPLFSSVPKADDELSVPSLLSRSIGLILLKLATVEVSFLSFESNSEPKQVNDTREIINTSKNGSKNNLDVDFINYICIIILKRVQVFTTPI